MRLALALALSLLAVSARAEDGGTPLIWAQCEEKFAPDAGDLPVTIDGGWMLLSPARVRYDACRIGSAGKCSELLAGVDAGAVSSSSDVLHLVTASVTAAAAIFSAYAANRSARHLGLVP